VAAVAERAVAMDHAVAMDAAAIGKEKKASDQLILILIV
jgi:hypothetical protein